VAHSWRKGTRRLAACSAALLAGLACDASAIALGDARVRSSLGDPLDLRIPVTLGSGESIEPACFSLAREPLGDTPRITGARISVERSAAGTQLRVESRTPVNEPAIMIGIVAACPGQSGDYKRDYSLLLDPPAAGRARPEATSLRAIAATLIARIGDTLESIANAIFPRNRAVKKSYIEAMRETNPALAALGDDDAIPVDTPIALPDLRTFAKARTPRATELAREGTRATRAPRQAPDTREASAPSAPRAERAPQAARPPRVAARTATPPVVPPAAPAPSTTPTPAAPKSAAARRARDGDAFVLRLSSSEVDLTRSRSMDDRKRAQLRERQLILDADDQVAAVLALRHSVKQLETRVAELQLKLAGMPSSFPPPRPPAPEKATPAPPPVVAPAPPPVVAPAPPPVVAATPPPPATKPAPIETPAPVVAKAPPPAPSPPATASPPAAVSAPVPAPAPAHTPAPSATPEAPKTAAASDKPVVRHAVTQSEWLNYGLWVLAVLLLFAAAVLAWRLWRRRRDRVEYETEEAEPAAAAPDEIVVADEQPFEAPEVREEVSSDGRRIIDADVELPTRLSNDSDDLRRRYIEERFPEITKGAIALDNPDSVVKGARLFYEDGAIARAVELLHYAIERGPGEVKAWLALFEIFRLERLTGEYGALAQRFKQEHGTGAYWPKVQYFGREIDPGNVLYQVPPIDKFETIGPSQARRIAADASFDPIAENWLGAPMDFENEVLANELRKAIMAEAGIMDGDLLPNPMPALRNVEMFTVA
jgi:pilus assembly protein FimV